MSSSKVLILLRGCPLNHTVVPRITVHEHQRITSKAQLAALTSSLWPLRPPCWLSNFQCSQLTLHVEETAGLALGRHSHKRQAPDRPLGNPSPSRRSQRLVNNHALHKPPMACSAKVCSMQALCTFRACNATHRFVRFFSEKADKYAACSRSTVNPGLPRCIPWRTTNASICLVCIFCCFFLIGRGI